MTKDLSELHAVSYLAPNWFGFYQSVTDALARALSIDVQLRQGECDPLEDPLLLNDQLDLAFICGLPFIRHHQTNPHQLQVLAAPVMQAPRYGDRPIYFSDLIVNATSAIHQFPDLVGKIFGYNDPGSNSGYYLVRWHLLSQGYAEDFFGAWIATGFHQRSLQRLIDRQIDAAAIDSTVLEQVLQDHPEWKQSVRVIETIGPSPMPPIVAANHSSPAIIDKLRSTLLHPDQTLQAAMAIAGVKRYAHQSWQDYEVLAERYRMVTHDPRFTQDY
ncbi:MAG: PhnD/SsuA/transferrin family substrate-binding protein [Oscillatoriales cyanobacterium C42_A2020_001]|nr:PhnD/SsuA/transferrin family substrate-binding protein [Leptolyngbyaceae cyanobacterium C42_A2020_001]